MDCRDIFVSIFRSYQSSINKIQVHTFERYQLFRVSERRNTVIRRKRITYLFISLIVSIICIFHAHYSIAGSITSKSFIGDDKAPVEIEAKIYDYRVKEGLVIAKGDVTITKGGQTLAAQEAIYNRNTEVVEVSGDVRFESGGDVLRGESGVFNLKDRTGKITKGLLFLKQNNYYISGDEMEKIGEDSYLIRNCHLTTCDSTSPAWSITGSEMRITVEGYGKVKNAAFRVHEIPFIYVPYIIFPAKTKRQTGLLPPRLGYSDRNGVDMEIPFFWAISDQTDATFYERIMSQRGLMQGFEFRYVSENSSEGTYLLDILSDRIETKDLNNLEHAELSPFARTNETRYWLRSRTNQQLPAGIMARLDTDVVSDQDYLKEFSGGLFGYEARPDLAGKSGRPVEETTSPFRRSALRLSRYHQDFSLQALASYHQRPEGFVNDQTAQPIAGFDFSILPRPLPEVPLIFSLDADHDYIWRDFGQKGHNFSITPELSYPTWFGPYLEFEPSIDFTKNIQWLDDNSDHIERQSNDAYRFQARVSTILERIYDFESMDVKRLKHKLSPSFSYEYRASRDEVGYRPWFEPIDAEGKINRVTLSIDNLLDVRKEDDKENITYAQWGTLSLSQGYDMDEADRDEEPWRKKEPFEPLVGILTFRPFPDLNIDAETHWDHYQDTVSFSDFSLELDVDRSGGRKDSYQIDYTYSKEGNKSLNYRFNINMLYGFSAGSSLKRDIDLGQNIEKSFWIEYLTQCWGIRLITEKIDEESSIMVTFRLVGLGEF
ncbi:LPS-assembly protein LptD [Thermodesulfobacteriota bacterium]